MTTESYPIEVEYSAGYWLPNKTGTKPAAVPVLPNRIKEAAGMVAYALLTNPVVSSAEIKRERTAAGYDVEFADESRERDKSHWDILIPYKAQVMLAKYRSVN